MRLGRRQEPKQDLQTLSAEQLSRVASAVRSGQALPEPELAGAAVLHARRVLKMCTGWRGWRFRLTAAGIVLYLLVHLLVQLTHARPYTAPSGATIAALFALMGHVYVLAKYPSIENVRRAERLNLQVLQSSGRPVPEAFRLAPPLPDERPRLVQSARRGAVWNALAFVTAAVATSVRLRTHANHNAVVLLALAAMGFAATALINATRARRLPSTPIPRIEAIASLVVAIWSGVLLGSAA
jgi:hypothetical protein